MSSYLCWVVVTGSQLAKPLLVMSSCSDSSTSLPLLLRLWRPKMILTDSLQVHHVSKATAVPHHVIWMVATVEQQDQPHLTGGRTNLSSGENSQATTLHFNLDTSPAVSSPYSPPQSTQNSWQQHNQTVVEKLVCSSRWSDVLLKILCVKGSCCGHHLPGSLYLVPQNFSLYSCSVLMFPLSRSKLSN